MVRYRVSRQQQRVRRAGPGYALARMVADSDDHLRPAASSRADTVRARRRRALVPGVRCHGRVEPMALTSELSIASSARRRARCCGQGDARIAGRRNVVGTVRVWCDDRDDKPTAVAQGTYALPALTPTRRCRSLERRRRQRSVRPSHVRPRSTETAARVASQTGADIPVPGSRPATSRDEPESRRRPGDGRPGDPEMRPSAVDGDDGVARAGAGDDALERQRQAGRWCSAAACWSSVCGL